MGHTQYRVVVVAMDWADLDLGRYFPSIGKSQISAKAIHPYVHACTVPYNGWPKDV